MNMEVSGSEIQQSGSGHEQDRHDYLVGQLHQDESEHELVLDQHDLAHVHEMRELFIKLIESDPVKNTEKIAELGDFLIKIEEKTPGEIQSFYDKISAWK